jgi:hypothetical protein
VISPHSLIGATVDTRDVDTRDTALSSVIATNQAPDFGDMAA